MHTYYQRPGGEDVVFESEKALLESRGHEVITFVEHNKHLNTMPPWQAAARAIWSSDARKKLRQLIRNTHPHIAHFHNTFLMVSPAAYAVCQQEGVPVVQTLHNYRLFCPAGIFYRDGNICEDCLSTIFPWPGVLHGCWRGHAQTAVVATMLGFHHLIGTWQRQVDAYIALTEFSRQKFIAGGLPADKIWVKPNFVVSQVSYKAVKQNYALFVGRLSAEKGIHFVREIWETLPDFVPLKIVGDGPLAEQVRIWAQKDKRVEWLGRQDIRLVYQMMQKARFLVFPSLVYETFGRTIIEAFAAGTPVIASRLGSAAELVTDGYTGLLVAPGDATAFAQKVAWAWRHDNEMEQMGYNAYRTYLSSYTLEENYQQLMEIYDRVLGLDK